MAEPVPSGSDVSAGTYKCTNCGYELSVSSTKNLPPCPSCGNGQYDTLVHDGNENHVADFVVTDSNTDGVYDTVKYLEVNPYAKA